MAPKPAQEKVLRLRREGLSEQSIRQQLKTEGYKPGRISQLLQQTRVAASIEANIEEERTNRLHVQRLRDLNMGSQASSSFVPTSSEKSLASTASKDNAEDTLWDPSGFEMPEGALLPHMRLPPACRRDLATMGEDVWERRLTVPPDGFCMLYTFLAACDPSTWSRLHRSELGFIQDVMAEQKYKEAAQNILMHILMLLRAQEKHREAARLEAGGHPGREASVVQLSSRNAASSCTVCMAARVSTRLSRPTCQANKNLAPTAKSLDALY